MSEDNSSPLSEPPSQLKDKDETTVIRPTASSRPTRTRAAPIRFADDESSPKEKPTKPTTAVKQKRSPRNIWSTNHLLTNPKSKFVDVNLMELLCNEKAWTRLSREEQKKLIELLPEAEVPDIPEDEPLPNIPKQFLKRNTALQADVRLFQEDLSAGRYDPQWLKDAQEAMRRRANGDFDDWKEKHQEAFWGQKQTIDWTARAGESSVHSLPTLIKAGYFQVDDIWVLKRGHRPSGGGKPFTVEKEAKIIAITDAASEEMVSLSFSFPPGQAKFSSPAAGEDITLSNVQGPVTLSNAILNEDGRIMGVRGANAWKEFRCVRKNQDMGSLWDIRELYHSRLGSLG